MFSSSQKGARLKHEGLKSMLEEARFLSDIRRSLSERLKPIIEIEAVKMGLVPLGISDAPVYLDAFPRTA